MLDKFDVDTVKIESLQVLRAVAAFMVASAHTINLAQKRFADPDSWLLSFLIGIGSAGVDIFFVISGFIMMYSTRRMRSGIGSTVEFWSRRIARVVPLYWLISVITLFVVSLGLSSEPVSNSLTFIIKSFFFIPVLNQSDDLRPLVGVGWTLIFEMFFYAFFGLAILAQASKRALLVTCALSTMVLSGILFPDIRKNSVVFSTYTDALMLEFLLGVWIAYIYLVMQGRGGRMVPGIMILLGCIALCVLTLQLDEDQGWNRFFMSGVPAALIVAGLLWLETAAGGWKRIPILSAMGDASYSLYLTHKLQLLGVGLLTKIFVPIRGVDALVFYPVMMVIEIIVAHYVFIFLEQRATKHLNRILRDRSVSQLPVVPAQ